MNYNRASGVLLHPTSLPGSYGIGDLGPQAHRWLDFLAEAGCSLWQVLPLGPTGYGDSPYHCFSAFAGNPYLISPEKLLEEGLLDPIDLENLPDFPTDHVDFGWLIPWKSNLLDRAYDHFLTNSSRRLTNDFKEFQSIQAAWLDDFVLFMALKEAHGGDPWSSWSKPLLARSPDALDKLRKEMAESIQRQMFRQFIFFRQWIDLRTHAHKRNIKIIGDIPIFVAHDSADVWANLDLFYMDDKGHPTVVAGVPPDYFSPTGQLWGNPLYRWDVHAATGYVWWLERFRAVLSLVDIIRLDHFRGFSAYWEVPAGNPTAEIGQWVPGPGKDLLTAVQIGLGDLPIIAEDLGVITPDVVEMRDIFNLPGMKILQFSFSSTPDDPFLPHNYPVNCVAYTGTHDNDTVLGWYESLTRKERSFCLRYLPSDGQDLPWDMVRAIWRSMAMLSLAPMQDLLSLGTGARMNFPGRPSGNWTWRMPEDSLTDELCERLHDLNYLYSRLNHDTLHL